MSAVPLLDFRWVAFATLVIVLEFPLLALRWGNVVAALAARNERMTHIVMIAITAIGQFFVRPNDDDGEQVDEASERCRQ